MATLLLSHTIYKEDKEFSDILNTVDINSEEPKVTLHSQAIADRYKAVSEVLKPQPVKQVTKKKSMRDLMQQSVFHGKNWMGSNFIA